MHYDLMHYGNLVQSNSNINMHKIHFDSHYIYHEKPKRSYLRNKNPNMITSIVLRLSHPKNKFYEEKKLSMEMLLRPGL